MTPFAAPPDTSSPALDAALAAARVGRPVILTGAEDRAGEADLVIPASAAGHEQITFMAIHASGLVCLALPPERAEALRLTPMVSNRTGRAAFTVSIEARHGVTTGISAHDRARTIAVAIDPGSAPHDLVSPGHVFPIVAERGGVLARPHRAEAAVDLARLAGLTPAAVTCEILDEDGAPAQGRTLLDFARVHQLTIVSAQEIVAHRLHAERRLERMVVDTVETCDAGRLRLFVYRDKLSGEEHAALVKGVLAPAAEILVRVYRPELLADVLGQRDPCGGGMASTLRAIAAHPGPAVAILLRSFDGAAPGCGRELSTVRQILADLGVQGAEADQDGPGLEREARPAIARRA